MYDNNSTVIRIFTFSIQALSISTTAMFNNTRKQAKDPPQKYQPTTKHYYRIFFMSVFLGWMEAYGDL